MSKNSSKLKKLIRHYDRRIKEREKENERMAPYRDRVQAIFDAPQVTKTDFWCNKCKRDCNGVGIRQVCTLRPEFPTAWFLGFCPKGHRVIRRITDKDSDPYYYQSAMLKRHRFERELDLLTPDDPRFKQLYPKQYKEILKGLWRNRNNLK